MDKSAESRTASILRCEARPRAGPIHIRGYNHVRDVVLALAPYRARCLSRGGRRESSSWCSHRGGQHRRGHRNPPILLPRTRTGACRNAPARQHGDLAGAGNGRGCISGRATRHDAEARALLGDRLRLAQGRGADQCAAQLPHRDGRTGHPFHSRSLEARECVADDRHAWMARLDHRATEDRRSPDQPDGAWRERSGRLPPRDSRRCRATGSRASRPR